MAGNWLSFGLVLALASLIAVWNWWSEMYDVEGQTFWQVVAGVAGTVLVVGERIGWDVVLILGQYFAVAAVPVGFVYFWRVWKDIQNGKKVMEGWYGNSSADREAQVSGVDRDGAADYGGFEKAIETGVECQQEC